MKILFPVVLWTLLVDVIQSRIINWLLWVCVYMVILLHNIKYKTRSVLVEGIQKIFIYKKLRQLSYSRYNKHKTV